MSEITGLQVATVQPPHHLGKYDIYGISRIDWHDGFLLVVMNNKYHLAHLVFDGPLSFRSQDEHDMLDYWQAQRKENTPAATLFKVGRSPYLDQFKGMGISGDHEFGLSLWLLVGIDQCLEVITLANEVPSLTWWALDPSE